MSKSYVEWCWTIDWFVQGYCDVTTAIDEVDLNLLVETLIQVL